MKTKQGAGRSAAPGMARSAARTPPRNSADGQESIQDRGLTAAGLTGNRIRVNGI